MSDEKQNQLKYVIESVSVLCMKCCLLLCLLVSVIDKGYANTIDTLSTTADVQKFLAGKFGKQGIIFLNECANISRAKRIRDHSSEIDTIMVTDPVTGSGIIKTIQHDINPYCDVDTANYPENCPFNEVIKVMDKYPLRFYKADIDGNGLTDLVVDAGIVIIVMDMGNKFEGHMFSDSPDRNSYSFKGFISLDGGSVAMLLKHNCSPPGSSAQPVDLRLYNAVDTVVYKFNGFAKYVRHFQFAGISKILYDYIASYDNVKVDGCDCIEINRNGQCFLAYKGSYLTLSGMLDSARLMKLWNYISFIDVKSKKDCYACEVDHSSGATFIIYFDDGTIKKIRIWAYHPPLELGYLSKAISDISKIVDWQTLKKNIDFECPCKLPLITAHHDEDDCNCVW